MKELADINHQVVKTGEHLPAVTLKDGTVVQTGTVATMLYNIGRYNLGARGAVEEELKVAIPTLVKIGLFELFSLEEWLQGQNQGRHFVAQCAKAYLNDKFSF